MYQSYTHPAFNWQPGPSEARFAPNEYLTFDSLQSLQEQARNLQAEKDKAEPKAPDEPKNVKVEEKSGRLHLEWEGTETARITVYSGDTCKKDTEDCVVLEEYKGKNVEICDIKPKTKYTITVENCKNGTCSKAVTKTITTLDPCLNCTVDTDCAKCNGKTICASNKCVECNDKNDGELSSNSPCRADGKICKDNVCVECDGNDKCVAAYGSQYICDDNKCILKPINWALILGSIGGLVALFFFLIIIVAFLMKR